VLFPNASVAAVALAARLPNVDPIDSATLTSNPSFFFDELLVSDVATVAPFIF